MVFVGSSEVSGSWKIIAMSLPRIVRNSASLRPTSSLPSSLMEPLTIFPPGGSSPMMDMPVIDFPHPDSPTSPRDSPGSMDRSTLPTAWTTDLVSWMCVDRSLIDRTGGIRATPGLAAGRGRSPAAQPDVEGIPERVAQQVAGHHHDNDADPDGVDLPPVAVLQVGEPVVEHVAPVEV